MDSRRALADFLRSRRASLRPADLGLPERARRHVPGLRREELAALAEVSVSWYALLEQGRIGRVPDVVLARIAAALRLNAEETRQVLALATGMRASLPSQTGSDPLRRTKGHDHMATISATAEIFTLINTFTVAPERQADVVASLREVTERFMRTLPGFVSACVHASDDGRHVANYVQWRSKADFEAMFARPEARAHMAEVGALAVSVMPIVYRVAYVGERTS